MQNDKRCKEACIGRACVRVAARETHISNRVECAYLYSITDNRGLGHIVFVVLLFSLQFGLEIKQAIGAVAFKMTAEYKRKSAELRKRLLAEGKVTK